MTPDPPKATRVLRDRDDELWTVEAKLNDGFEWRLPIIVKPHHAADDPSARWYYVHGANYNWSPQQYSQLAPILDHHDCVPSWESGWWFTQSAIDRFATKASGITPDFYIRWPGYETPRFSSETDTLEIPEEPGLSPDETKFLRHLQNMTGTQTWEALKFLWLAFRKQAVFWIARERRPLDLGFIRIIPMPYRANWKEALAVRFSGVLSCFRSAGRAKRQETLQEAGFFKALSSVQLLAVDKEKVFCHWTLETMPSTELEEAIDIQEYAKFQRQGPAGYVRHILRSMETRLNDTMRIFSRYVGLVCHAPGRKLVTDQRSGTEIIVAELREKRVRPGRGLVDALELSPAPFARLSDQSDSGLSPEPASEKLKLPEFIRDVAPFKELPEKIDSNGFT